MSEAPRLTRKQLREMGKLEAKPSDAPALTDTQELRLRRPSRKEMREAERAERERNELLALQGAAEEAARERGEELPVLESDSVPTRKSVFERFKADTVDFAESDDVNNLTHDSRVDSDSLAVSDANRSVSMENENQRENADFDADSKQENAFELAQGSLREQLFARMRRSEKRDLLKNDVSAETVSEDMAVAADNSFTEAVSETDFANKMAEKAENASAEDTKEKAVLAVDLDAESANLTVEDSAEMEAETNSEDDFETEVSTDEPSMRSWFVFLILAIIFALIGYLIGSWIDSVFFSSSADSLFFNSGNLAFLS